MPAPRRSASIRSLGTNVYSESGQRARAIIPSHDGRARAARFVVINFGHCVGCIEGTTRLSSIGWRFYQSYRCYHRRKAPSPCPKRRAAPNRFTSPPPPHLWCLPAPCRDAMVGLARVAFSLGARFAHA